MKDAVLDPAILFISETDWQDEAKQDRFLNHLLHNLETIDRYSASRIVWNDELEMCLWGYPQVPPWRKDRNWRNTLVPTLYTLLQKNRTWIENDCAPCLCGVAPPMSCCNAGAQACFLKLIHTMILRRQDVVLCLGLQNIPPPNGEYAFTCTCCPQAFVPGLIRQANEWLQHVDLDDDHWQAGIGDAEGLGKALDVVRIRDMSGVPFRYEFSFSDGFLDDVSAVAGGRLRILRQMARRLAMTAQEARLDTSLRDEYVSRSREHRFRVTPRPSSTRIHYTYENEDSILFLRYYGVGHHEDGLR